MTPSVMRYTIGFCLLLTACISEPDNLGISPTGSPKEAWYINTEIADFLHVTRDGSLFITSSRVGSRRTAQLFDAANGQPKTWPAGLQPESGMLSDDLQFFAYSRNDTVRIVRWPSGEIVTEVGFQNWPSEDITASFAWNPSNDLVYVYIRGYNTNGIFQLASTPGAQPTKLIDAPMFQSYDDVPQFRLLKNASVLQISEQLTLDLRTLTFTTMPIGEERFFGWPAGDGVSWYRCGPKDVEKIDGNQQRSFLLPLSTAYASSQTEANYLAVDANERFAAVLVERYSPDNIYELWIVDLQNGAHVFHQSISDTYSNLSLYVEFDPTGKRAVYGVLNGSITKWTF